ncbi:MAG: prepilin-type N-terminal cleavage/methylation domain-containing protein [Candidatus Omnitrophica bacterium]|nr:prepilin-type N-terminal cleavage/methylation domain-containing protein [Candidatus Omnitrophota bacterium]MDD5546658.1 prepilin-type N-terminal cleavage/methylation domain-containing protein [Candidatus Omnitrophota bacterium]
MKILRYGQRRAAGYTLIEMTIVLFIILAFLAMSVPFFGRFSSSTGLRTAEREVGTVLRTARSYAISRNSNFNAEFDTSVTPNTYRITDSGGTTVDSTKLYQLPAGINFTATVTVTFTPNGGLTSAIDASVTVAEIKDATKFRTITVDAVTGAVTMP